MKLSDTQLMILSAASQREDQTAVLPSHLKANVAKKVVDKLIREGLLQESPATDDMPVWRRDGDNRPYALCITKIGLKAIAADGTDERPNEVGDKIAAGAERGRQSARSRSPTRRQGSLNKRIVSRKATAAPKPKLTKKPVIKAPTSKQDNVLAMLRRPEGASLERLVKVTGWQKHSVRGFLAGTVRRKLKLPLVSERIDGVRTYRIGKVKALKGAKAAWSRRA
jgi:hypothetical protein